MWKPTPQNTSRVCRSSEPRAQAAARSPLDEGTDYKLRGFDVDGESMALLLGKQIPRNPSFMCSVFAFLRYFQSVQTGISAGQARMGVCGHSPPRWPSSSEDLCQSYISPVEGELTLIKTGSSPPIATAVKGRICFCMKLKKVLHAAHSPADKEEEAVMMKWGLGEQLNSSYEDQSMEELYFHSCFGGPGCFRGKNQPPCYQAIEPKPIFNW